MRFIDLSTTEESFIEDQVAVFEQAVLDCRRQFDETLFENIQIGLDPDHIHPHVDPQEDFLAQATLFFDV